MLVFIAHGRRLLVHVNVTAAWVWRQLIEATPWAQKPRHLLRDHDAVYGRDLTDAHHRRRAGAAHRGTRGPADRANRRLGSMPRAGRLVTLGGFGLWAYTAAIPNRRGGIRSCSRGWSQSARSCSASAGSDHVRSHAARLRWCSSPDYALVRMAGFTAILLYGVGWAWLGYRVSRLSTVG